MKRTMSPPVAILRGILGLTAAALAILTGTSECRAGKYSAPDAWSHLIFAVLIGFATLCVIRNWRRLYAPLVAGVVGGILFGNASPAGVPFGLLVGTAVACLCPELPWKLLAVHSEAGMKTEFTRPHNTDLEPH